MVYTEFSREQIVDDLEYLNLCEYFFQLSTNDLMRKKLEGILYDGGYSSLGVSTRIGNKDSYVIERIRRISIANLLIKNQEAFDELVAGNINIFHGTNGNCLMGILKYGFKSSSEAKKSGIIKESWIKSYKECDYVSFTDVLDVAEMYASLNRKDDNEKLAFPVIFGTSEDNINKKDIFRVNSTVPEICVKKCLPVDSIKIILVPFDKVDFVKKIVGDGIKVFGIDYYYDKFYSLSSCGKITVLEDKFEEYLSQRRNSNSIRLENIENVIFNSLNSIRKKVERVKVLVKSGIDTYESGRNN